MQSDHPPISLQLSTTSIIVHLPASLPVLSQHFSTSSRRFLCFLSLVLCNTISQEHCKFQLTMQIVKQFFSFIHCLNIYLIWFSCRDGTTDVTRTFHFGEPTRYEKVSCYIFAVSSIFAFAILLIGRDYNERIRPLADSTDHLNPVTHTTL